MKIILKCKSERKTVAHIISDAISETVIYERTPTYAYRIGDFHIDREGYITAEHNEIFFTVLEIIQEHIADDIKIQISGTTQVGNRMRNLIQNKQNLIEKSIGGKISTITNDDYIEISCSLDEIDLDKIVAIQVFFQRLHELASTLKYVSTKEKEVINERYTFRCFLLRLGFVGNEYKSYRNILLKNLNGSSAFKNKVEKEVG